ncbi:methyl-accepting chemotaxis protein [Paenibacillus sp. PL2-23]|uniref:methyl-accepting chemotaxis protein n=1 Tax=Paenibacillus sp. PL2-23 TaxID=2100729 RepID=UPI0030FB50FB
MKHLRSKILLGFAVVLILLAISGASAAISMDIGKKQVDEMVTRDLELITVSEQLSKNVSQRVAIVRGYALLGDSALLQDFRRYTETSKALQRKLLVLHPSEDAKKLVALNDEWRVMVEGDVFPAYASGNIDKAMEYLNTRSEPAAMALMTGFDQLASSAYEQINTNKRSLIHSLESNQFTVLILTVISILTGTVTALYLAKSIVRPIIRIINRIHSIANGDLRGEPIIAETKDEIAGLAAAMNGMVENLRRIVGKVHENAGHISSSSYELSASARLMNTATGEIAASSQEIAAGTRRQTESMNDNAVAMSEISIVIGRIAEATQDASQAAIDAKAEAEQGCEDMHSAIGQMGSIQDSINLTCSAMNQLGGKLSKINTILAMLNEISTQTKLLALNASVEAARAGDTGRGFSVVADEMKKLSDKSADSSESIAELVKLIHTDSRSVLEVLEQGVHAIERGMQLVERAGESFDRIKAANSSVASDIQEIASSAQQMSAGSEQLAASLAELTSIAQQSLLRSLHVADTTEHQIGAMEEITVSSGSLSRMSVELKDAISAFKT